MTKKKSQKAIRQAQKEFLLGENDVTCRAVARQNTLNATLQHNKTYNPQAPKSSRYKFRESWKSELIKFSKSYYEEVSEEVHIKNIKKIAEILSKEYGKILHEKKLRFGTSQKSLNLYLKYLWCMGEIPCPPHCPFDSIVLKAAKIKDAWTKNDSIPDYRKWVSGCREISEQEGYSDLSSWELMIWNEQNTERERGKQ